MSQRNEIFRTEADVSEAQAALLAWSGHGDADAQMNRLRDHTIALCTSLRVVIRERDLLVEAVTRDGECKLCGAEVCRGSAHENLCPAV